MTIRRHAAGVALAGLGLWLLAVQAPAFAHHKPGHSGGPGSQCPNPQDNYPPGQCNPERASVDDNTLTRGQSFSYYAQGFEPGTSVTITMHSAPVVLGTAPADAFSFVEARLTVPVDAEPGPHDLVATGAGADGSPLSLTVPVTVTSRTGAVGSVDNPDAPGGGTGGEADGNGTDGGTDAGGTDAGTGAGGAGAGGTDGGSDGGSGRAVTSVLGVGLPRTGTEVAVVAVLGAALLVGGAAAVAAGKRRSAA